MISIQQLHKTYYRGTETVDALRGIDLEIGKGEFVIILGPSGGGKSTLLNMISGIDHPSSGSVKINGFSLDQADEEKLTLYRRDHIGFIFQFYNLFSALDAVENTTLPLLARGIPFKQAKIKAVNSLKTVGLGNRLKHLPSQLSGGEQQRVAIARSVVAEPELVLADEPTGDLDSVTAHGISNLLHELNKQLGITILVATHNLSLIEKTDRVIELRDGQINPKSDDQF